MVLTLPFSIALLIRPSSTTKGFSISFFLFGLCIGSTTFPLATFPLAAEKDSKTRHSFQIVKTAASFKNGLSQL